MNYKKVIKNRITTIYTKGRGSLKNISVLLAIIGLVFYTTCMSAANPSTQNDLCKDKIQGVDCLIFSAPPRGKNEEKTYEPIVKYLSAKLKIPVYYKKPTNWWRYNSDMRKDANDILFDGPHYVSWRVNNINHVPILRLPEDQVWLFIVHRDSPIKKRRNKNHMLDDLIGKKACVQGFTNFARLSLFSYFKNPLRQPIPERIGKRDKSYLGVVQGKCAVGVVSAKEFERLNATYKTVYALASLENYFLTYYEKGVINEKEFSSINVLQMWDNRKLRLSLTRLVSKSPQLSHQFKLAKEQVSLVVRVLHKNKINPNQAITVSARISPELRQEILSLLTSLEGKQALLNLRNRFTQGLELTSANKAGYRNVHEVLQNSYGFGDDFARPESELLPITGLEINR